MTGDLDRHVLRTSAKSDTFSESPDSVSRAEKTIGLAGGNDR